MDLISKCQKAAELTADKLCAPALLELSEQFMDQQPNNIRRKYTEMLAVFDRNQEYIGSANWYFVHYFGFHYTATTILVYLVTQKQYLLQRRAANVSWPNLLDCSAGGCCPASVRTEEERTNHARQELLEELFANNPKLSGLELTKLCSCLSYHQLQSPDGYFYKRHFNYFYRCNITSAQHALLIHNSEVKTVIPMSASEIQLHPREDMAPGLLTALEQSLF